MSQQPRKANPLDGYTPPDWDSQTQRNGGEGTGHA